MEQLIISAKSVTKPQKNVYDEINFVMFIDLIIYRLTDPFD